MNEVLQSIRDSIDDAGHLHIDQGTVEILATLNAHADRVIGHRMEGTGRLVAGGIGNSSSDASEGSEGDSLGKHLMVKRVTVSSIKE
jgi:hypothetical protein